MSIYGHSNRDHYTSLRLDCGTIPQNSFPTESMSHVHDVSFLLLLISLYAFNIHASNNKHNVMHHVARRRRHDDVIHVCGMKWSIIPCIAVKLTESSFMRFSWGYFHLCLKEIDMGIRFQVFT